MPLSARNQLRGIIEDVSADNVLADVRVRVGENLIEAVITRRSVSELGLKKGDEVTVVIKATEVMIAKP